GELGQAFRDALNPSTDDTQQPAAVAPEESAVLPTGAATQKSTTPPQRQTETTPEVRTHPRGESGPAVSASQPTREDGVMLNLNQITENPKLQPRLRINEDHVLSLADKFRRSGQLNAIL